MQLQLAKVCLTVIIKIGKVFLITYFILNLATMFTIQTAVTIVTAGLASSLFGITDNMVLWSLIITIMCYIYTTPW